MRPGGMPYNTIQMPKGESTHSLLHLCYSTHYFGCCPRGWGQSNSNSYIGMTIPKYSIEKHCTNNGSCQLQINKIYTYTFNLCVYVHFEQCKKLQHKKTKPTKVFDEQTLSFPPEQFVVFRFSQSGTQSVFITCFYV